MNFHELSRMNYRMKTMMPGIMIMNYMRFAENAALSKTCFMGELS